MKLADFVQYIIFLVLHYNGLSLFDLCQAQGVLNFQTFDRQLQRPPVSSKKENVIHQIFYSCKDRGGGAVG